MNTLMNMKGDADEKNTNSEISFDAVKGIMNLRCFFVVEWKDYIGYADFDDFILEADYRISEISHNRRGDLRQEIVAHLPKEKVKLIYKND